VPVGAWQASACFCKGQQTPGNLAGRLATAGSNAGECCDDSKAKNHGIIKIKKGM
jgi:hypothetical protein